MQHITGLSLIREPVDTSFLVSVYFDTKMINQNHWPIIRLTAFYGEKETYVGDKHERYSW